MRISDWSSDVCSSDLLWRRKGWSGRQRRGPPDGALATGPVGLIHVETDFGQAGIVARPTGAGSLPLSGVNERGAQRSEEHTSELQSLMRISYAVFCLKEKKKQ